MASLDIASLIDDAVNPETNGSNKEIYTLIGDLAHTDKGLLVFV